MAMWNPWRGCKKCSDGCLHCYIHKGDFKRNINTNEIVKTKDFEKPIEKLKSGNYKMKSGIVYTCFSTDFLVEEADKWRKDCFKMIKERQDCTFLFLTKRIDRFLNCIPDDWHDGYENVIICCTVENQKNADYRLSIFKDLPIKHKYITAQPLLENINIEKYLDDIELVIVGGESDINARPLNFEWVLNIREQCMHKNVNFEFRQCGTYTIKDGKTYKIQNKDLMKQAKLANINYKKIEYNLKKADRNNIKLLKKYKLETILEHASGISEEETNRIKKYVDNQIKSDIDNFQLIIVKDQIIGCLLLVNEEDGILLDTIYIIKEYRNIGIGTDIIKKVMKNKKVCLWVYKDNVKAVKLYKKLGYKIIKETDTRYYMQYINLTFDKFSKN